MFHRLNRITTSASCIVFVLLIACSPVIADAPPASVTDEQGKLAKANAAFAAYQGITEWAGTFHLKEIQPDGKGQPMKVESCRVRFQVLEPRWRIEQSLIGNDGFVKATTIEVFDGQRNWVYQERAGHKIGMINTHTDKSQPTWIPTHPDVIMAAQEVRGLVKGGQDRSGRNFSYYAGKPKGAPGDTEAFVSLGKNGWPGWAATFLDPARQYTPVEIWGGMIGVLGKNKTTYSSWREDEKGRAYAGEMVDEINSPPEEFAVTYSVTAEQFERTVDSKLVEGIAFPKGTRVTVDMQPASRYVVGEEKH